jgi:predicted RNase H-like HicB family nuclease
MRYAIVIEKAESNYSAYVPDLPGCIATGTTVEEVESQIRVNRPGFPGGSDF